MKTLERLTLVLDPEGRDRGGLYSVLLQKGHVVATRRSAIDCLKYVSTYRPALVLLRVPGEGAHLGEAIQRISPRTRVLLLGREGRWQEAPAPAGRSRAEELRETVERLIDQEMRERLASSGSRPP